MAYLEAETLTCPGCGKAGEVTWVIGVGPGTGPGEGPAYTDLLELGPWQAETKATAPRWQGRITCPDCGATVFERPGGGE